MDIKLLIQNSYKNKYSYDFESFHKERSKTSEYHMENGNPISINNIGIQTESIYFSDGISKSFALVNYNDRNYLVGDHSCYPCSIVYRGALGQKFIEVYVIPIGQEIICGASTDDSPIICSGREPSFYLELSDSNLFKEFLLDYEYSFSKNKWWSSLNLIIKIKRNNQIDKFELYTILKNRCLLNPIELCLGKLIFDSSIENKEVLTSIFIKKDVPRGISYITPPSFNLDFASSSSNMVNISDLESVINGFSKNELEKFMNYDFINQNIDTSKINKEILSDIFSMSDSLKWNQVSQNCLKIGLSEKVVKQYYKLLKNNVRKLENELRNIKGFRAVGTLYNENLIFRRLKEEFFNLSIISQYSPDWLGSQRFDIYIKEYNIAIEYNGIQHYQPVEYFGGKKGFEATQKRDMVKRKKCKLNNCFILEIKYDENLDDVLSRIREIVKMKEEDSFQKI